MFRIPLESRRSAGVLCVCLLVGSVLSGIATTLQAGYALQVFGGVEYIPRILALSIPRVSAPHVAAMSACFALVAWAHRSGPGGTLGTWRARLCLPLAIVPVAALPAAVLTFIVSFGTAVTIFGLTRATFAAGVLQAASASDVAHGLTKAGVYGAMLGAGAAAAARVVARAQLRLRWKLALAWLAMGLLMALVDLGIDSSPTGDAPTATPIELVEP